MRVQTVRLNVGGDPTYNPIRTTYTRVSMSYFDAEKKIKRTVSSIDDLNFARTVVLAMLIADQNYAREQGNVNEEQRLKLDIRNIKRSDRNWKVQSQQFLLDVDLDRDQVFGFDAFQIVANFFPNYRITVYTRVPPAKVYSVYWKGNEEANKALNIAVFAGVFDTFEPNRSTIGKHVCPFCHTPYMHRDRHKCELMCDQCRRPGCEGSLIQPLECPDCHVIFYRQDCYDSHKIVRRNSSVCSMFKRCPLPDCRKFYKPANLVDGIHVCGDQMVFDLFQTCLSEQTQLLLDTPYHCSESKEDQKAREIQNYCL